MTRTLLLFLALLAALATRPALADTQDIAAASRSVVRVALVATKGGSDYFVGHGSGIVVTPDRILTNAHVVELVREEPNIMLAVIPAEGKRSYAAKIVAYSPGNDLALIQIVDGRLPPATFFAAATQDGQAVVAIGYPGNVDRAEGMALADIIQPMSPVKSNGTISGGRSSKQFDTILHTAPLASGNSGGPLVDTCGRVLGVNSLGTVSDADDAEYGFAVSNREVANFLRQAGVQFLRTVAPCRSLAELDAAERTAAEQDRIAAEARAAADAGAVRERDLRARLDAEQSVIGDRENVMALAGLLLALALASAGAAGLAGVQGHPHRVRPLAIGGALLFVGALVTFFLRPGFGTVDDRAAEISRAMEAKTAAGTAGAPKAGLAGDNLCRLDLARSRVTVSDTADVPVRWTPSGCINGKTQLVPSGSTWSRVLVPSDEPSASVRSFDPATGLYRSDKYALDAATAEAARKARAGVDFQGCTTDPDRLAALASMEANIRALLPPEPNERLVYHCAPAHP